MNTNTTEFPISNAEIVLLHHNEAMTTSLAIAGGIEMEHNSVMILMKKHIESLSEFGRVQFEIEPFETNGGLQVRDVAFLNEQQATLLITFMRNSPVVIKFKIALVKAFFELRDRASAQKIPKPNGTLFLSHGADIMVAADRTFRSLIRAGRQAGLPTGRAIHRANTITRDRTGIDLLQELDANDIVNAAGKPASGQGWGFGIYGVPPHLEQFLTHLQAGDIEGIAFTPMLSTQLWRLYTHWCRGHKQLPLPIVQLVPMLVRAKIVRLSRKRFTGADGTTKGPHHFLFPLDVLGAPPYIYEGDWLGECVTTTDYALEGLGA